MDKCRFRQFFLVLKINYTNTKQRHRQTLCGLRNSSKDIFSQDGKIQRHLLPHEATRPDSSKSRPLCSCKNYGKSCVRGEGIFNRNHPRNQCHPWLVHSSYFNDLSLLSMALYLQRYHTAQQVGKRKPEGESESHETCYDEAQQLSAHRLRGTPRRAQRLCRESRDLPLPGRVFQGSYGTFRVPGIWTGEERGLQKACHWRPPRLTHQTY